MTTQSHELGTPAWRKSPVQGRSRRSEAALAGAARRLLAERPYEEIRVEDVARQAGISVGGFYARFRGKSALLHLADMDFLDACRSAFDEAVPEELDGSVEDVLRRFVTVTVHQFGEHRRAVLQAMRHAGADDASGFRERAADFNAHVHGRLRRLLGRRAEQIEHADTARAVNMAIFFASAAARDAVLRGSLAAYPVELTTDELVDEIVLSATRYLTGSAG